MRLQQRLRAAWADLRFAYEILIAPWPPFALLLAVTAAIGYITPLARIKVTTGLLDALAAHLHTSSPPPESLLAAVRPFLPWLVALMAIMVINWLIYMDTYQRYLSALLTERVQERFERRFLRKALALRLEECESAGYHDLLERTRKAMAFDGPGNFGVGYLLTQMQRLITTTLGCFAVVCALATVHWALAVLLVGSSVTLVRWRVRRARHEVEIQTAHTPLQRKRDYLRSLLSERGPAAEVRLFDLSEHLLHEWRSLAERLLAETAQMRRHNAWRGLAIVVANLAAYGAVMLALLLATDRGLLSVGGLVAMAYAVQQFLNYIQDISWRIERLGKFFGELRFVATFLELEGEEQVSGLPVPSPMADGIRVENAGFTYPGGRQPALKGIDLHVRPGERIALVGENGAGKSTFARLLLGLYCPTVGRITVDGVDLQSIAPAAWRSKAAAVFQDHARFAFTVRENIGLGNLEMLEDGKAIAYAARLSGADTFIEQFAESYETLLGKEFDGGHDLSGGQWQKLAIARAYLRDADFLVLDEPASALDALAELEVYRQFVELAAHKTVLLISHRLGSARLADRVVFLEGGRIVQQGTHEELIAAGGPYADLYRMQAEWYRAPEEGTVAANP